MKIFASATFLFLIASPSFGQDLDCSSIKQEKSRLVCYDKQHASTKGPATSEKKVGKVRGKQFTSHNWTVVESIDPMTDKKRCTAIYKNDWNVQANDHDFMIPMRRRGGVDYYTVRFNDDPADELQNASSLEKDVSAVVLTPSFDRAYSGKRLRVQIHTLVAGTVLEDIDLSGFKDSIDYIRSNCLPLSS